MPALSPSHSCGQNPEEEGATGRWQRERARSREVQRNDFLSPSTAVPPAHCWRLEEMERRQAFLPPVPRAGTKLFCDTGTFGNWCFSDTRHYCTPESWFGNVATECLRPLSPPPSPTCLVIGEKPIDVSFKAPGRGRAESPRGARGQSRVGS